MPDLTTLPEARLREERQKAADLVLALKCRLMGNLPGIDFIDLREALSYAEDRLALAESEIARRRLGE